MILTSERGHTAFRRLCAAAALLAACAFESAQAAVAEQSNADASRGVPALAVVLEQARANAPYVRLGRAAAAVSRAEMANAKRAPVGNPNVEILGQRGANGATRGIAWGGTMWLPFEVFGQRGRRITEARAYADMFDANVGVAEAAAMGEAYAAYGAVHVESERIRVIERMVSLAERSAALYEARLTSGDAVLRDATMAKVELARNRVLLQDANRRLAQALTTLNLVTGETYTGVASPALQAPSVQLGTLKARMREQLPPRVQSARLEEKYYRAQHERLESESGGPVSLMLMGGRGDLGEARVGVGLAYELPLLRSLQGERMRALSEALRAKTQSEVSRSLITRKVDGIMQQYAYGEQAYELLTNVALPAAQHAVASATQTLEAGKTEWTTVLISRRDLAMLALERLEVVAQQWSLLGELIQLTGEVP